MSDETAPSTCPKCGGTHVLPILWHWIVLSEENKRLAQTGQMILGSEMWYLLGQTKKVRSSSGQPLAFPTPEWACLDCEPRWSECHRLALEVERLDEIVGVALDGQDFEKAAAPHAQKSEVIDRLIVLLADILNPSQ